MEGETFKKSKNQKIYCLRITLIHNNARPKNKISKFSQGEHDSVRLAFNSCPVLLCLAEFRTGECNGFFPTLSRPLD